MIQVYYDLSSDKETLLRPARNVTLQQILEEE